MIHELEVDDPLVFPLLETLLGAFPEGGLEGHILCSLPSTIIIAIDRLSFVS